MSLRVYRQKRNFKNTPEPRGKKPTKKNSSRPRFVVQMHKATRLHFDLRLEFDGVYKSWAIPKGPSLNPLDQRLAVYVEDHPLEYGSFEGLIPSGNYGAGTVVLWDEGTYLERQSKNRSENDKAFAKGFAQGHLTFILHGHKLKGEFALIKLKNKGEDAKSWLLVKKRDEFASYKREQIFDPRSVKTGRSLEEIKSQSQAAGDIWISKPVKKPLAISNRNKSQTHSSKTLRETMPRNSRPMLATPGQPAHFLEWKFEVSPGGLRALAEVEGTKVRLYSRSGLPFEKKFPLIVKQLQMLDTLAVFDGEIVKIRSQWVYVIFDLLYFNGQDLRKKALKERQDHLSHFQFMKPLQKVETVDSPEDSSQVIIAKRISSPYKSGTSKDWLRWLPQKPPLSVSDEPRLTHLDKVYWPEEKITKGDLINYYQKMAPLLLPYLKDRPQSLHRYPNGILAQGFYQKDLTGHLPKWLKTHRIFSESAEKSVNYALCQDEKSLLYLVNLGCIELNPWFSRVGHLDKPDFLVIDLDPDGNPFHEVMAVAHRVHEVLEKIKVPNFCKTSGATGLHIGVPTGAHYSFDEVRFFAEEICRRIQQDFAALTSLDRNPQRRLQKIYLDCLQNRRGQTLAAPYSVRPRPGAPISMPLLWQELTPKIKPEKFHLKNAMTFLNQRPDPWKGILGPPVNIEKALTRLKKIK